MITVKHVWDIINTIAPFDTAESWDNSGLLIGNFLQPVTRILIALDVNEDVIHEAISQKYDLIITHHPLIFSGLKQINHDDRISRNVISLIKSGISVIAAHTNIDRCFEHGINKVVADKLKLSQVSPLGDYGVFGYYEKKKTLDELIHDIKAIFKVNVVKVAAYKNIDADRPIWIDKVAFSSGASIDFLDSALKEKVDVYITSDVKYHEAQQVIGHPCTLIDVGHYESESIYLPYFRDLLLEKLLYFAKDDPIYVHVSSDERPIFNYF